MLMVSYDISDAYYSVSIHESHKVFLELREKYNSFLVLPTVGLKVEILHENTKTNILYIKLKVLLIPISYTTLFS